MRSVQEHFDLIAKLVEHSGAESVEIEFDEDQQSGTVDGALYFYDGSRLEFIETVTIERYRPVKLFYVYQYIRGEEGVFRYDNALTILIYRPFPTISTREKSGCLRSNQP